MEGGRRCAHVRARAAHAHMHMHMHMPTSMLRKSAFGRTRESSRSTSCDPHRTARSRLPASGTLFVTLPPGFVTLPPGFVTLPPGFVTLPPGFVTLPPGLLLVGSACEPASLPPLCAAPTAPPNAAPPCRARRLRVRLCLAAWLAAARLFVARTRSNPTTIS